MTSRRVFLVIGAGAGLAAVAGYATHAPGYDGPTLDAAQAHAGALDKTLLLIDIRRPDEWALTGIGEGAQPLDMRVDDFEAALDRLTGGNRALPIALICARGVRSARLAAKLSRAGFSHVIDVPEGMLGSASGPGWLARGLAVRKG